MAEIKDFARLCNAYVDCEGCPFEKIGLCSRWLMCRHPAEADRIITEWCKEHPQKTYAMDFFEKFPNAPRRSEKFPVAYACDIYSELDRIHCKSLGKDCEKCWNEVMPDA